MKINLDFGGVFMPGRLFDTEIGRRLFEQLMDIKSRLIQYGLYRSGFSTVTCVASEL